LNALKGLKSEAFSCGRWPAQSVWHPDQFCTLFIHENHTYRC